MRLLIVSTQTNENASTFIKLQYQYLQPFKILHSGYKPYICDGKSIFDFPLNNNLFRVFVKKFIPILYTFFYNKALQKFLVQNEFDIVLCNFGTQGSNVSPACFKIGLPLIVHFHGYDAYVYSILKKYKNKYNAMFKRAARFVVGSNDMFNQILFLGAPKEKIVKNLCGFDSKSFVETSPEKNDKRLLFVGNFVEKKAPDLLVKAFSHAIKKVPDAKLIIIGWGKLSNKVIATIKALGLEKPVQLLGWQPTEVVSAEIQKARAYVQHSRIAKNGDSEGTAVTVIEAAGSGLPVISTRHGGIKETVIEGVTGFLVDEGDWESMGDYMIKLLNEPELAGKMGRAARNHILTNYTVERQMTILKKIMHDTLAK